MRRKKGELWVVVAVVGLNEGLQKKNPEGLGGGGVGGRIVLIFDLRVSKK